LPAAAPDKDEDDDEHGDRSNTGTPDHIVRIAPYTLCGLSPIVQYDTHLETETQTMNESIPDSFH
jgi:hypothetical protein